MKVAIPHPIGTRSDVKRLKTCQRTVTLGQAHLTSLDAVLYTGGSGSLWAHTHQTEGTSVSLWGPIVTDQGARDKVGAFRPH